MWQYDDDNGMWEYQQTGYSYDPAADQFSLHGADVTLADVPLAIRQELENTARNSIFQIIHNINPIDQGVAVNFTHEFDQGAPIMTVQLDDQMVFGSDGASPCLIIFSVGWSQESGAFWAKGAHRDNAFSLGEEFLQNMTAHPNGTSWDQVGLYVIGGEVGSHTGADGATMDYSRYYPFFLACQQFGIQFKGVAFPSNPTPDDTSGAALSLANDQPNVHYWITQP